MILGAQKSCKDACNTAIRQVLVGVSIDAIAMLCGIM